MNLNVGNNNNNAAMPVGREQAMPAQPELEYADMLHAQYGVDSTQILQQVKSSWSQVVAAPARPAVETRVTASAAKALAPKTNPEPEIGVGGRGVVMEMEATVAAPTGKKAKQLKAADAFSAADKQLAGASEREKKMADTYDGVDKGVQHLPVNLRNMYQQSKSNYEAVKAKYDTVRGEALQLSRNPGAKELLANKKGELEALRGQLLKTNKEFISTMQRADQFLSVRSALQALCEGDGVDHSKQGVHELRDSLFMQADSPHKETKIALFAILESALADPPKTSIEDLRFQLSTEQLHAEAKRYGALEVPFRAAEEDPAFSGFISSWKAACEANGVNKAIATVKEGFANPFKQVEAEGKHNLPALRRELLALVKNEEGKPTPDHPNFALLNEIKSTLDAQTKELVNTVASCIANSKDPKLQTLHQTMLEVSRELAGQNRHVTDAAAFTTNAFCLRILAPLVMEGTTAHTIALSQYVQASANWYNLGALEDPQMNSAFNTLANALTNPGAAPVREASEEQNASNDYTFL